MKHTKGPWAWQLMGDTYYLTAQHGMREIIIEDIKHGSMGYPVVGMNHDGILKDVDPEFPNAQLIASAPETAAERDKLKEINTELLEALEIALWAEENGEAEAQDKGKPRLIERLKIYITLIAKAKSL